MDFINVKLKNIIYFMLLLFFGMFILFYFFNISKENFDTNYENYENDDDDDEDENNASVISRTVIFEPNN